MEAPLRGFHLRYDTGCIVCADFLVADAARPGAHGGTGRFERDGFKAGGEVRTDGRSDNVKEGGARWTNAEGALGTNHCRAKVEGVAA